MNAGDKITIKFNDKDVECTFVQPGVVQKSKSIFYIQDSVSGIWSYSFPQRLERLNAKFNGDLSHYKDRATKKAEREVVKVEKKAARIAKMKNTPPTDISVNDPIAQTAVAAG